MEECEDFYLEMEIGVKDVTKFRPLRDGEDTRFCDLVHLAQRSFTTLKEVGRLHDMDNNHMLALIDQRMCKVWARHQKGGNPSTVNCVDEH